jgi:hypothetical protein
VAATVAEWPGVARQALATVASWAPPEPATDARPAAPTRVARDGSAAVASRHRGTVAAALADAAACQERHLGRPDVAAAYRRIAHALGDHPAATVSQNGPALSTAGETVREPSAWAAIQVLDGTSRSRLLSWLADTDPELAARGLAWLAEEHAASVERARLSRNRRATLRSRRRRARQAATP